MPNNALFVIRPYKWEGVWVFDDPDVGLVREPFVAGMPEMIELATANLRSPELGFVAVFAKAPFPDAQFVLERVRDEYDGTVYTWREAGLEGWLCPALLHYFEQPPEKIYIQIRPRQL